MIRDLSLPATGRFVVLEHDYPFLHWDLMLEADGTLRTWRLPAPPAPGECVAEALPDHRLAYLDYEGPVSGNRGQVIRWDRGTYALQGATVHLHGERTRFVVQLAPIDGRWRISFAASDRYC